MIASSTTGKEPRTAFAEIQAIRITEDSFFYLNVAGFSGEECVNEGARETHGEFFDQRSLRVCASRGGRIANGELVDIPPRSQLQAVNDVRLFGRGRIYREHLSTNDCAARVRRFTPRYSEAEPPGAENSRPWRGDQSGLPDAPHAPMPRTGLGRGNRLLSGECFKVPSPSINRRGSSRPRPDRIRLSSPPVTACHGCIPKSPAIQLV